MNNLITEKEIPKKRIKKCNDNKERYLTEPAVMLAIAMWLLGKGANEIKIHPDGQHLKQINMRKWLELKGFRKIKDKGTKPEGGIYSKGDQYIEIFPKSGLGDITTILNGLHIEFEAKGGCINSEYPGHLSGLRKKLHEAVGQLLSTERNVDRLIAAIPYHRETKKLAEKMASRCKIAGIEIALVKQNGEVYFSGEQ